MKERQLSGLTSCSMPALNRLSYEPNAGIGRLLGVSFFGCLEAQLHISVFTQVLQSHRPLYQRHGLPFARRSSSKRNCKKESLITVPLGLVSCDALSRGDSTLSNCSNVFSLSPRLRAPGRLARIWLVGVYLIFV